MKGAGFHLHTEERYETLPSKGRHLIDNLDAGDANDES